MTAVMVLLSNDILELLKLGDRQAGNRLLSEYQLDGSKRKTSKCYLYDRESPEARRKTGQGSPHSSTILSPPVCMGSPRAKGGELRYRWSIMLMKL